MADEIYQQFSDPLGNRVFSAGVAVLPLVTLIYFLAIHPWTDKHGVRHRGIEAYRAVFIAVQVAVWAAIFGLGMPGRVAGTAFLFGAAVGLFPIGWVVSAAMFLYQMTVVTGYFDLVKSSIVNVSQDRRIQVLLIGFAFGAFLEGAAGFGVPVAIGGALLVGLGFESIPCLRFGAARNHCAGGVWRHWHADCHLIQCDRAQ